MRSFSLFFLFGLGGAVFPARGQAPATVKQSMIRLSGKVTDNATRRPVALASVYLLSGNAGTATNELGAFLLKVPAEQLKDTVVISCLGYVPLKVPVAGLPANTVIVLQPSSILADEITLKSRSGLGLVKKALAAIPANYDTTARRLNAFYREKISLGDFELSNNEAVLDIYKVFAAGKTLNDQMRIVKGRKKKIDYGRDAQFYYWISSISNGARGSLGDDLLKYSQAENNPLNPENYRYYAFQYAGSVENGTQTLAHVHVTPKKRSAKGILELDVYLDEDTYVIHRIDYALTEAGVRETSRKNKKLGYFIMSKFLGASLDYHKFTGTVTYKPFRGKWYLDRVTRHWEILVESEKRNMFKRPWTTDIDLVVTGISTEKAKPIESGNIGDKDTPFSTLNSGDYNDDFWENYNILKQGADVLPAPAAPVPVAPPAGTVKPLRYSNRQNGFTRADTLRGTLSPLRSCYDVTFYHLDVAVDPGNRSVSGNNLIRFKTVSPFRKMQLDLYQNMVIDSIVYRSEPLTYRREFDAVFIDLPHELAKGDLAELKVWYHGVPKTPNRAIPMDGGILWDTDSLGNTWAQVVSQGSGASLWWPNKDHQSDEPDSMKTWITVPSQFTEISNGRLTGKTNMPGNRTRYEWAVSYPINNYNVTFNIGMYDHYTASFAGVNPLTIDYYVMPYNCGRARKLFSGVPGMLKVFEDNFGAYPFNRDGFTLVESLYPMEHQSGVCIGRITEQNATQINPLLWHESAHEWWGNAITAKDIADMWIHEAFATYAEVMVAEKIFGKEPAYNYMLEEQKKAGNKEPITGVYNVNHIHYDIGDMYSKGSLMLHTFRNMLANDGKWTALLRAIQNSFRYQTLSAASLIGFINNYLQQDYTPFFKQYLEYTRIPVLEVKLQQKGANLLVTSWWTADAAGFKMPARVTVAGGRFGFIYPSDKPSSILLKNMTAAQFDVDKERFYIGVKVSKE
ncbi:M1 family aminopeptidase [Hufsiella ginkgonis]|uniref:Peptidase M1 membrane alanine aminopeptidase domain-containing protein n=1 Tax=Hufsiella ginkgonis TaxID=2695274 RepID=A0A7K1XVF4_9SPHI|nr:M1 family aminopeptidase [Hufsiella ginkgonis]MXV14787.1 hypothetical protein [Hufsiella ginkgonis]